MLVECDIVPPTGWKIIRLGPAKQGDYILRNLADTPFAEKVTWDAGGLYLIVEKILALVEIKPGERFHFKEENFNPSTIWTKLGVACDVSRDLLKDYDYYYDELYNVYLTDNKNFEVERVTDLSGT